MRNVHNFLLAMPSASQAGKLHCPLEALRWAKSKSSEQNQMVLATCTHGPCNTPSDLCTHGVTQLQVKNIF